MMSVQLTLDGTCKLILKFKHFEQDLPFRHVESPRSLPPRDWRISTDTLPAQLTHLGFVPVHFESQPKQTGSNRYYYKSRFVFLRNMRQRMSGVKEFEQICRGKSWSYESLSDADGHGIFYRLNFKNWAELTPDIEPLKIIDPSIERQHRRA